MNENHSARTRCRWQCGVLAAIVCLCVTGGAAQLWADYLFYSIPGTRFGFLLEGRVQIQRDRNVNYYNATLKQTLNLPYSDVKVLDVPTVSEKFASEIAGTKDADVVYAAAVRVMKRGAVAKFYEGVEKTLALDPKHAAALAVKELKAEINKPIGDSSQQEAELRAFVKKDDMKIATSKHFILLHDTSDKAPAPDKNTGLRRKKRSEIRLDLLEQVYEAFLLLFYAQDVALDIPRERLKVVLFNDIEDYTTFSRNLNPDLTSASGYWDSGRNISVFYDHSTTEVFQVLKKSLDELTQVTEQAKKQRAGGAINADRFVKTLQLLVLIAQENADITVVSHEATHQMAGNTGLFPRYVQIPSWAHEGLATYFESPGEMGWSGMGAVNDERLTSYKALEPDREHSNIDFIVGDQIFKYAVTHGAKLHGYGQAWAFTHFLMEKHLAKTVEFYRRLGEMPPDVILNPELLTALFDEVFGTDRKSMDAEWRSYMKTLKTDLQRAEADLKAKNKK